MSALRLARSWIGPRLAFAVAALVATAAIAPPASAQSITDRFKSLFGGGSSDEAPPPPVAGQPPVDSELTCPVVTIRPGASTYAVGLLGKAASGADLRFQVSITRTVRNCVLNSGIVTGRIGVQGRVIVGPAGAPPSVDIPMRVAVVQEGVQPKTIFTRAYTTSVPVGDTSVPFSFVMEDVAYPAPTGAVGDSYVFYIGFDPQALKSAPKPSRRK